MREKLHVLLVDDDDLFFDLVGEILESDPQLKSRMEVERLCDGQEAIERLIRDDPTDGGSVAWPDLVLLDQRMPLVDGTKALEMLRSNESTRDLVIGILSSSDQDRLVREAYGLGANIFVVKPFEFDLIHARLRAIADFFLGCAALPQARSALNT